MTQHRRVTFDQARDVLLHAIEYLTQTESKLKDAAGRALGERERLLLDSFRKEQSELRSALTAYEEDAPERALNTFIQFTTELPEAEDQLEEPLTTSSLTRWLENRNAQLSALFREIANSTAADTVSAAFTSLNDRVQAHNRKLSKEYQRFEDL